MSNEDKIASKLLEFFDYTDVEFEAHYNHYGSRGVIDLVLINESHPSQNKIDQWRNSKPGSENFSEEVAQMALADRLIRIIEVKSESALRNSTGANEVIRQFKRHKEYFFKGSDYRSSSTDKIWHLIFEYTPFAYNHVKENADIYNTIHKDSHSKVQFANPKYATVVDAYDPDDGLLFSQSAINGWFNIHERSR